MAVHSALARQLARLVNEVRDSRKIRVSQSAASTSEAIAPGIADGTPLDQWYLKFENQFRDVPPEPAAPAEFAPAALPSISLASGPITFGGGVPVGGWSNLSLYPNGWFNFVGHFHDSGAPSYNVDHVWSIWSPGHGLIMIGTQGHMAGTFESGSRDFTRTYNNFVLTLLPNGRTCREGILGSGTLMSSGTSPQPCNRSKTGYRPQSKSRKSS
jgi:hypothetical protein